jgi:glycosyltransferase involved in cell wall biosynthesis
MKIAIATVQISFVKGGAEFLAENLKNALIAQGHEAEIITMPFVDSTPAVLENHIVASRLLDINNSWGGHHDLCIALKFPAYYMPHDNKVVWALHQHRAAYDLFDTEYSNIKNDAIGNRVRDMIYNADRKYLREAKAIYTIAQNVSDRMERYTHIHSTPLYHPCPDMEKFYHEEYGDYILMPSRINITKRQMLALEAMTYTKSDVKLCLLGRAENPIVQDQLLNYIKEHGLEKRVQYMDFVPQDKKLDIYARAKAILFIPKDEDYGYITLEGMAASKPVITMKDSGGPLEFITDGVNGIVSDNSAVELARHLDEVWTSRTLAQEYGRKGRKILNDMDITWEHVVKELVK